MKHMDKVLVLGLCILGHCAPQYIEDIDFAYQEILDNHPGVYNERDPLFNQSLDASYASAKDKLQRVTTSDEAENILEEFIDSFDDAHLRVSWHHKQGRCRSNNHAQRLELTSIAKDTVWITLPTFVLSKDQREQFRTLIEKAEQLPPQRHIIFDIRGNGGGNSLLGEEIMQVFFGKKHAVQKLCHERKKGHIAWRASQGNVNHILDAYKGLLATFNLDSLQLKNLEEIKSGLENSLANGEEYYIEYPTQVCEEKLIVNTSQDTKFTVITDSANGSSALIFIDELKLMTQNIVLLGKETSADTLYTEIRHIPLPSGSGSLVIPIKVRSYRKRLSNETYVPDIAYDDIQNTESLKVFVLEATQDM
ncbi:S41 family peptidase [Candidatus Comchoanobacter bicostacola]|uniref:S41 family peptidase n=1 Tax=Candidatus Comchoanobacter bicostacola TaxID=2919598 RepID=A0ABY5DJ98_9GAMM|nr:S41 family peptidase [Candidatus Comchoanobacter bicostacola]UTC24122.1 S41 family peptidase [Candidatus Comchoanobacter bicostacola]